MREPCCPWRLGKWADIEDSEDDEPQLEEPAWRGNLASGARSSETLRSCGTGTQTLNADAPVFVPAPSAQCPMVVLSVVDVPAEVSAGWQRHRRAITPEAERLPEGSVQDSQEVWEHRVAMRTRELASLRARLEAIPGGADLKEDAPPPDPTDRSVSRRTWKREVNLWFKTSARRRCSYEGCGSLASTEEWQSVAAFSASCDEASECRD
mmetsp:Transcript_41473/g.119584  ORF Transcript_41473/g.119584 Transcript_41473/m.119584 type:complete len:209 (-) Transcript_41473:296-922(-)